MTVRVKCPSCQKELSAPDELIGKKAKCPSCHRHFPISLESSGEDSQARLVAAQGEPAGEGAGGETRNKVRREPPPGGEAAAPSGPSAKRHRDAEASSAARTARRARFIAAEAIESGVDLTADGQLPRLVLQEEGRSDAPQDELEQQQSLRPLLMVGAFCFSICASVVMLLLDAGAGPTETEARREARRQIEEYYTGKPKPTSPPNEQPPASAAAEAEPVIQPYQQLLRQALQAHNRGDFRSEQRLYRKVLDMLHAEGKNEYYGLTGRARDSTPTFMNRQGSDEHLEQLLSSLLAPR